ncbi:hypothetical protein [Pengzhenrongella sicca]|uniref:Uncharacterized protein n=1 Tax=Pengzhenrongella sicca TaxID=2819238 RepID=A0A8A4ZE24_9MICO|nr:hypothetical protein [Pengzhenrongella sicca]QTE30240.1 hypothetical protein J4E96_04330 [Pengzhenrongella sicca]
MHRNSTGHDTGFTPFDGRGWASRRVGRLNRVPAELFVSLAPRREDVILHRALGGLSQPRFLEVTADPNALSRCVALESRGWVGTTVAVDSLHTQPPSSAEPLHAVLIGVADPTGAVVGALDLLTVRPWIAVLAAPAATRSAPAEAASGLALLLAAGYEPALFDGAAQYLVAPEHSAALLAQVDHPAGPDDSFQTLEVSELERRLREVEAERADLKTRIAALEQENTTWRARAMERWSEAAIEYAGRGRSNEAIAAELTALHQTLSWRITRPLRVVKTILNRSARKARADAATR